MDPGELSKIGGVRLLVGTALCLAIFAAPAAAAEGSADWMYSPGTISEIELTLPAESRKALEEHPESKEYQRGTFSIAETNGAPGSAGPFSIPIEVGIRLKGSLGSLRTLDQKAAFKIKFGEFVDDQTYLGLKKMTLNNMVQDPSMLHETLAYEAFHALGVPAPNTGYAYLRVDGEDFGLHLNIETLDKVALEKRFGSFASPPQHLYEGEYGADVTTEHEAAFEVDEGKKSDKSDLGALVTAVNAGPTGWLERVGAVADLTEMSRMWATEKYIGHWDGYSGETGGLQPNNYYLFSDADGMFQMLPWGTDQTWGNHLAFDGSGGVLFNDCLNDPDCETLYREAASEALGSIASLDLDTVTRCTAARLRPWQELESSPRRPFDSEEIAAAVKATRQFIADRPAELAAWLKAQTPPAFLGEPPCQTGPPDPPEEPPPSSPTTSPGSSALPPPSPSPAGQPDGLGSDDDLRLGHVTVVGKTVKARLTASTLGWLGLRGTLGGDAGGPVVCGGHADIRVAGPVVVHCSLSRMVRHRLEGHWLRLRLEATFLPAAGVPEFASRTINLRRR
jgi:hypothetical protein